MPESRRLEFVKAHQFSDQDAKVVVGQWNLLQREITDQDARQAGVDIRTDLTIPQLDDPQGKKDRVVEVEERRKEYRFEFPQVNGRPLPPFVAALPRAEQVGSEHKVSMFAEHQKTKISLAFNRAIDMVANLFTSEDPFKDWADLYRTTNPPAVVKRWRRDDEFAQQRFNGINPTLIRRVEADFPWAQRFPVSDALLQGVIPSGSTIASLSSEGRLFICDYEELHGLPAPPENYLTAPLALFFVDNQKQLMPAAIQLYQVPSETNPIFTPNPAHTTPGCWAVAKMHVQVADALLHEVTSHYLATHAYVEVIYISMMRNLAVLHPVSELLRPHFWFTMALQSSARSDLIAPGCALPRLMACGYDGMVDLLSKSYLNWKFSRFDLPTRLQKRGVDDPEKLPNCYYRDDGLRMYRIIEQFVSDLVQDFYPKVDLMINDPELKAWAKEMVQTIGLKGLPVDSENRFASHSDLTRFLTGVIFAATAGHSMVNNGQWDYFGFIPNCPGKFRIPPPTSPQLNFTDKEIAAALPGFEDTCDQIAVVKALSTKPTKLIGQYHKSFMAGRPKVLPIVKDFQDKLAQLSKDIKARNATLEVPYPYLDPENVSNCVDV